MLNVLMYAYDVVRHLAYIAQSGCVVHVTGIPTRGSTGSWVHGFFEHCNQALKFRQSSAHEPISLFCPSTGDISLLLNIVHSHVHTLIGPPNIRFCLLQACK